MGGYILYSVQSRSLSGLGWVRGPVGTGRLWGVKTISRSLRAND